MPQQSTPHLSGFDPSSQAILAQFVEPPPGCEVNPRALSPFLRALLEIDGTVTRFIEAYMMEPIDVLKLGQGELRLPQPSDLLQAQEGSTVTTRQVLLQGCDSKKIYSYGSSLILPERMPENARKALQEPSRGLGRIMRETRMETYREIVWRYREYSQVLPEALRHMSASDFISRTYRIIWSGKPIMLINEKFPSSADLPDHH